MERAGDFYLEGWANPRSVIVYQVQTDIGSKPMFFNDNRNSGYLDILIKFCFLLANSSPNSTLSRGSIGLSSTWGGLLGRVVVTPRAKVTPGNVISIKPLTPKPSMLFLVEALLGVTVTRRRYLELGR